MIILTEAVAISPHPTCTPTPLSRRTPLLDSGEVVERGENPPQVPRPRSRRIGRVDGESRGMEGEVILGQETGEMRTPEGGELRPRRLAGEAARRGPGALAKVVGQALKEMDGAGGGSPESFEGDRNERVALGVVGGVLVHLGLGRQVGHPPTGVDRLIDVGGYICRGAGINLGLI